MVKNTVPDRQCFLSVVVITCASHAQGRRFEPGRKQTFFLHFCLRKWKIDDISIYLQYSPIHLGGKYIRADLEVS